MYLKLSVTKVSALKLEGRALILLGTVLWYRFSGLKCRSRSNTRENRKNTILKVRESSVAHISYRIATVPALPRKGPDIFLWQLVALQGPNINLLVSGGRTLFKLLGTGKVPTYSKGKWSEFSFTWFVFKPLNRVITTIMDEEKIAYFMTKRKYYGNRCQ